MGTMVGTVITVKELYGIKSADICNIRKWKLEF